jgi:hypothetical protein
MGWGKGSKSSSAPPPQQMAPAPDTEAMMAQMTAMMHGLMQTQMMTMQQIQQSAPQMPDLPLLPQIASAPTIDWAEKQEQLSAKQKADYHLDRARKKGAQDTVLTSPLLDDEDPKVTGSILAGKS